MTTDHTGRPALDLDAIRARYDAATEIGRTDADLAEVAGYVPDLLAEVERLRARPGHGMIPGSHERPDGPECRCGAAWDRWNDRCATAPATVGGTDLRAIIAETLGICTGDAPDYWADEADAVVRALTAAGWPTTSQPDNPHVTAAREARAEVERLTGQLAQVTREVERLKGARLISALFGHHPGAPRPFSLYRSPGRVPIALGAEFPDGAVALRLANDGGWTTKSDGGAEQFADASTDVVWLSDEFEALAEQEARETRLREGIEAEAAGLEELAKTGESLPEGEVARRLRALLDQPTETAASPASATETGAGQ